MGEGSGEEWNRLGRIRQRWDVYGSYDVNVSMVVFLGVIVLMVDCIIVLFG